MFRPYESLWDFVTDKLVIYSLLLTVFAGVTIPYIVAYFVRVYREKKLAAQRGDSGKFNSDLINAINYHRTTITKKSFAERSDRDDSKRENLLKEDTVNFSETHIRNRKLEMVEAHKKFVTIDDDKDSSRLSVKPSSVNSSRTSLSSTHSDKENELSPEEGEILMNGTLDANSPSVDTGDVLTKITNLNANSVAEDSDIITKLTQMELHGKLATAQLKVRTRKLQDSMTDEEREQERKIREEQLNAIFALMKSQEEKFGLHTKGELEDQLKMYNV